MLAIMKTWFHRFKTSISLDREASVKTPRLCDGTDELIRLHRALSTANPAVSPPETLHDCIMESLSAARTRRVSPVPPTPWLQRPFPRFALGATTLGIALAIAFSLMPQKQEIPELSGGPMAAMSATVLAATDATAEFRPLAPLEEELELLGRDIQSAADLLLGAWPL
jgi:hypothetical protein